MSIQERKNKPAPAPKNSTSGAGVLTADFLRSVPNHPGVYLMKNRQGQILYVGKAKDLRKRVSSYQRVNALVSPKTVLLLDKVAAIETIMTRTEKEAFILEASLIKKHRPRFNIELKDDKSYPRIKVTLGEEWPRKNGPGCMLRAAVSKTAAGILVHIPRPGPCAIHWASSTGFSHCADARAGT
jgi:predicted GIY-YIG superfamily endonuclease